MARPQKEGLDYFPLDVKMDDKIKLIEAKFGISGFGVLIKLYQIVYDNGYYIKWTERERLLYSSRINADFGLISQVVDECLRWDLFSMELYTKYEILTSRGIQKRYVEATQRRKDVSFIQEYLLLEMTKRYPERVIVNINRLNADNIPINTGICTQRKVKERKEKKNKGIIVPNGTQIPYKDSSDEESPQPQPAPYQDILKLYHNNCHSYPKLLVLSKSRKDKMHTRWLEHPDINEWQEAFSKIEASSFCKGNNRNNWKATLDWLIDNDKNMLKVLEGNYDDKTEAKEVIVPVDTSILKMRG